MAQSESKQSDTNTELTNDVHSLQDVICVKTMANSVKVNKLSSGVYRVNENQDDCIQIVAFHGNLSWIGVGHLSRSGSGDEKQSTFLVFKEEMLYLMQCGCCELIIEYKTHSPQPQTLQTCAGINNAFTLFFSSNTNLAFNINYNIYSVYKHLRMKQYVLKRTHLFDTDIDNLQWKQWQQYLMSKQTELCGHFERISYWIWKRDSNNAWWKSLQQGFMGNSIQSLSASIKKLSKRAPDALLLIKKDNVTEHVQAKLPANVIHDLSAHFDDRPIFIASAAQNDVLLVKFERNNLLQ